MDNYLGEIRIFPFGMVPRGWHACDGSLLNIQQNQALYALIGIKYGGNGSTNFALPDLRGRTLVDFDPRNQDYLLGKQGGAEAVTLTPLQVPVHTHTMQVANATGKAGIATNRPAIPTTPAAVTPPVVANIYTNDTTTLTNMSPDTLQLTGGSAAHPNMQPFLTLNYCIAITGLWPSRP